MDRIRAELTETEWLVLDYIGVVSVDGVPNVQATEKGENGPAGPRGGEGDMPYGRPMNIDNQTVGENICYMYISLLKIINHAECFRIHATSTPKIRKKNKW